MHVFSYLALLSRPVGSVPTPQRLILFLPTPAFKVYLHCLPLANRIGLPLWTLFHANKLLYSSRSLPIDCSSPRSISIGQLNTSPCLHPRPIKLVVYKRPYQLMLWDILS